MNSLGAGGKATNVPFCEFRLLRLAMGRVSLSWCCRRYRHILIDAKAVLARTERDHYQALQDIQYLRQLRQDVPDQDPRAAAGERLASMSIDDEGAPGPAPNPPPKDLARQPQKQKQKQPDQVKKVVARGDGPVKKTPLQQLLANTGVSTRREPSVSSRLSEEPETPKGTITDGQLNTFNDSAVEVYVGEPVTPNDSGANDQIYTLEVSAGRQEGTAKIIDDLSDEAIEIHAVHSLKYPTGMMGHDSAIHYLKTVQQLDRSASAQRDASCVIC